MATRQTKPRPAKAQAVQHPKRRQEPPPRRRWWIALAVAIAAAAALVAALAFGTGGDGSASAAGRLPNTSDYHSLAVSPDDPDVLLLGTHQGLFRSRDGGHTWAHVALSGQDAMNLARPSGQTLWAAGHDVLAKSTDGGATWSDVRPAGLPHLDVHGFAAHPQKPATLYAALANVGLFRSTDGGRSFRVVSQQVGPAVMALAVRPDDTILAGDMQQGLMRSTDSGRSWSQVLAISAMGIAINPATPNRALATGDGIYRSEDGGRTWQRMLPLADGAGPVAWAPGAPNVAYAVGFDRTLYRSGDGGARWIPVR